MATFYSSNLVQTLRQDFSLTIPGGNNYGYYYLMPSGYYGLIRNAYVKSATFYSSSTLLWLCMQSVSISQVNDPNYSLDLEIGANGASGRMGVFNSEHFSKTYPNGIFMNNEMGIFYRGALGNSNNVTIHLDIDVYKII